MPDIKFENGVQSFVINDCATVEFSPTDSDFAMEIYKLFEALDEKQKDYSNRVNKETDPKKVFEITKEFDKEIRKSIDDLFKAPICDKVFKTNVMALANGLPVWCNLILAVVDKMDIDLKEEKSKMNARVEMYTNRWKKK